MCYLADVTVRVIVPDGISANVQRLEIFSNSEQMVILECTSSGTPKWTKNGKPLLCSPKAKSTCSVRNNRLTIRNIDPTDAASYVCEDVSTGSKSVPFIIIIKVTAPPAVDIPYIVALGNQTATVGSNHTIPFNITNAHSYKFYLDGQGLTMGEGLHYDVVSSGNLLITGVNESDNGEYSVVATNFYTHMDATKSVYLTVIPKGKRQAANAASLACMHAD